MGAAVLALGRRLDELQEKMSAGTAHVRNQNLNAESLRALG